MPPSSVDQLIQYIEGKFNITESSHKARFEVIEESQLVMHNVIRDMQGQLTSLRENFYSYRASSER